ncbi:hypothetical protein [Litorimonas sp.]|uniref:hypothetical protein n=1 Tax=Litorimonas sp. TaxID=1892381 RepID=UPI003A8B47EA
MTSPEAIPNTYQPSHPWYYRLGAPPLFPSQIKASVDVEHYPDFMIEDILAATAMAEPQRSERLRSIRCKIRAELRRDLAIYLERLRELKARRLDPSPEDQPIASCVYTAMSLKHNHIYNDYAQLMICEKFLSEQGDLFSQI